MSVLALCHPKTQDCKNLKLYLLSTVLDKSMKLNFGSEEVKQGIIVDI